MARYHRSTLQWNCYWICIVVAVFQAFTEHILPTVAAAATVPLCRSIPGDSTWPTSREWSTLNKTVGGQLIATVPIGRVCHDPDFADQECTALRERWGLPSLHASHPAEIMAPLFRNQSCEPFTLRSSNCTLGNYASYSVRVRAAEDVAATIRFATKHNIRVVIKNTGHDFMGKSTGLGSLAIWTKGLNKTKIINKYNKGYYKGPAMKIDAGVTGGEAVLAASKRGYRVVAGSCGSVGIAGGYTQGGGHSLLSGVYGLGADNVLEWEVVTADGRLLIATPNENKDLYWALSGGGGGTYGVVISMTTRLFHDGKVGRAGFSFSATTAGGHDEFWAAVDTFHSHLQRIVDNQGIVVTYILNNDTLIVPVITAPSQTKKGLTRILAPMMSDLARLGLSARDMKLVVAEADTYHEHFMSTFGVALADALSSQLTSGRIISRNNMANNATGVGLAMRTATASGHFGLLCSALNVQESKVSPVSGNAVQSHWRNGLVSCVVNNPWDWTASWDEMLARQHELTNTIDPVLKAATPGSGTYLNEANFEESDWKNVLYGNTYHKLRSVKTKYDPDDLFYATTAVGSDAWQPDSSGRLCRTKK